MVPRRVEISNDLIGFLLCDLKPIFVKCLLETCFVDHTSLFMVKFTEYLSELLDLALGREEATRGEPRRLQRTLKVRLTNPLFWSVRARSVSLAIYQLYKHAKGFLSKT